LQNRAISGGSKGGSGWAIPPRFLDGPCLVTPVLC